MKKQNKLLAFLLSMMMLSSGALFACSDETTDETINNGNTSTETEETVEDKKLITNSDFETFNTKDGLNLIGTSISGWSVSLNSATTGQALEAESASGIVDTQADAWKNLTKSKYTEKEVSKLTEAEAEAVWDSMSAKDKLDYYKAWKDNADNKDKDIKDLSFYEAFNITSDDVPTTANPGTHYAETDTDNADKTKVLMLRNQHEDKNSEVWGTAQKVSSSSTVTVNAGTSAKFSFWVKTQDLTSWNEFTQTSQPAIDKGAFVRVSNTLGGKSLDAMEIKNINTDGVEENNGWVQYSFVLHGSAFADSTFSITFGLGQGGGTDRYEYVNGYAFFDDVQVEIISESQYQAIVDSNSDSLKDAGVRTFSVAEKGKQRIVTAGDISYTEGGVKKNKIVDIDYSEGAELIGGNSAMLGSAWTLQDTREERGVDKDGNPVYYTSLKNPTGTNVKTWQGLSFDGTNDYKGILSSYEDLNGTGDTFKQIIYDDFFKDTEKDNDFLKNLTDKKTLILISASGASYTASLDDFTLSANSYRMISFFVKTSDMDGFTGAGVRVQNINLKSNAVVMSSISTPQIDGVKVGETEDYYDGWKKVSVFISNETDEAQKVKISLSFGPTGIVDSSANSYKTGFAAFTGFETYSIDEKMFEYASTGDYSKVLKLENAQEIESDDSFDSAVSVSERPISDGYANLKNYKGVTPDSDYVKANATGSNLLINTNQTAGLLSKDELTDEDGVDNAKYTAILNSLGATGANNAEKWESIFGGTKGEATANQPLVIYNQTKSAYGFIGNSSTINGYTAVSVRVKVSEGAKAYLYLVDMDDISKQQTLSVGRNQTYWYTDDGDICVSDPTKSSFNARKDVAFKLQSNGLYKMNPHWFAATLSEDVYYANLSVYEKDVNGNLLVAENGVSYNYNNLWKNDGNDGIAFYYDETTDRYYADSKKTIPVHDLKHVKYYDPEKDKVVSLARYEELEEKNTVITVNPTYANGVDASNGYAWKTVTFYVHAKDVSKNYRLEVWSGARNGEVESQANSYVIFDDSGISTVEEATYQDKLAEKKDIVGEENYFESVFSFYDSAKFLRYDETADELAVGNSYDEYKSSDYSSGVAYLYFEDAKHAEMYVDYAYTDVTVSIDPEEVVEDTTEEEEETTGDETNPWMLASSIALVAVLLFAIVSIIFRKVFKKFFKKFFKKNKEDKKTKKAKKEKAKKEKKARKQRVEQRDEDSPYND